MFAVDDLLDFFFLMERCYVQLLCKPVFSTRVIRSDSFCIYYQTIKLKFLEAN